MFLCFLQLDAKNSPLALLAQTCSQIGADTPPNSKSNLDHKGYHNHHHHHHKKTSSLSSSSSSENGGGREKRSPSLSSSSSCSNSASPPGRSVPVSVRTQTPTSAAAVVTSARSSFKPYESCVVRPAAEVAATAISLDATIRRATPVHGGDRCSSKESASSRKSPDAKKSHEPHKPSAASAAVAALMAAGYPSPHHHGHPSPHHHMAAVGSPLMSPYYRPGAATAGGAPLPCRDPYCAGCQLAAHLATGGGKPQPSPCPTSCTQCDGSKTAVAATAAAHHHQAASAHHHQQQHQHTMAAAYAHAQLAALAAAASQLPYVCSWMGADLPSYCGKRFGTSDELLQHLRTHTSDPAAALPLLQRSYPTPPLSPSTARYHPYAAAAAAAAAGKHHSPYFPSGYPSSPLALPPHPGLLPPYFPAVAYSPYAAAAAAAAAPRIGTSPHT